MIAALLPYLDDPDVGAEAALVLAAIPRNTSMTTRDQLSAITAPLHQSRYQSPAAKGTWSPELACRAKIGFGRMFCLANAYRRAESDTRWQLSRDKHPISRNGYSWSERNVTTAETLEDALGIALETHARLSLAHSEQDIAAFATASNALTLTVIYAMALWPHNWGQNWELDVLLRALHLERVTPADLPAMRLIRPSMKAKR